MRRGSASFCGTSYFPLAGEVTYRDTADNMDFGDLGSYGSGGEMRGMPTPRLDRLASEGLRLSQFLVEPGCTPSRAALMLGRYSPRAGLGSIINAGTPSTLQDSEVTLAELFKR